jgi:hypothetical protein
VAKPSQTKSDFDAAPLFGKYAIPQQPTADEITHRLEQEKADSAQRRALELKAADAHDKSAAQMRFALGIIAAACLIFIGVHQQVDDLSRSAFTLLTTIVTGAFAYIAGQKAGKS